ncbi:putative FAD-dependent pyridine nucleotide-disulphide oxidoreductase [Aurantimonas manganoxydans SI85-9A1]|uniref:Thioredoxin reductase n=1 Tax=Aurantimonas manganoxydans (strain ATCC BAA-1229 / DSM 21871 / SI85-9A1) TaxID=287752 RepID=Q1YGS4_AURMS|nr:NAD(P)/FAD-dependent oxidoreductase [Aurantimonas manganoxydans]EAS49151.1 putative FAD-dependent pyridine nucleotide-disulphide oxidoreductase [Aurantimonas manganoxydans SI85-9A1]
MQLDAIVVGGSFAGLSAATYIARGRRTVAVIDAGSPRNRFAARSHGFIAQDGTDPRSILSAARAQLAAYRGVSLVEATAHDARPTDGGFAVVLEDGEILEAARLVLAFGVSDLLPDVPGLRERWGHTVLHCPYCHGYEFAGQRLGVLQTAAHSTHQAMLIAEWGPTTLFLDGSEMPDAETRDELTRRGIRIEPAPVLSLEGDARTLSHLVLGDGREVAMDALFIAAPTRLNSDLADRLGCAIDGGPFGSLIRTNADKLTSVPGIYAAGDIARAQHSVTWAASDGVTAGVALHRSLVFG